MLGSVWGRELKKTKRSGGKIQIKFGNEAGWECERIALLLLVIDGPKFEDELDDGHLEADFTRFHTMLKKGQSRGN
jgi:hypothetical protein